MRPGHDELRRILSRTRVIACVGVSPNPVRPSNYVARYLSLKGFRVIPVNPGHVGETLFGETVVRDVTQAPEETDMVDLFRRSEHVLPIVRAAIGALPNLRTVWMQIGVRNEEAAELARREASTWSRTCAQRWNTSGCGASCAWAGSRPG